MTVLSVFDAAKVTGYTANTVQKHAGTIPGAVKVGMRWAFTDETALKKWADDKRESNRKNRARRFGTGVKPIARQQINLKSQQRREQSPAVSEPVVMGKPVFLDMAGNVVKQLARPARFDWEASVK